MKNIIMILTTLLITFSINAQDFWEKTNGPYGGHINTFAVDSSGRIFAGTAGGGIFRSTDNGESWTPKNNGLTATEVFCLVANASENIFAGTFDYQDKKLQLRLMMSQLSPLSVLRNIPPPAVPAKIRPDESTANVLMWPP